MIKRFFTHIKRNLTLEIECSDPYYWKFFNNNLLWLKQSETVADDSYDIRTTISKLREIDSSFIDGITKGYGRYGYNLFVRGSSVVCLQANWLLWKYEADPGGKIHIDIYYAPKNDNYLLKSAKKILGRRSQAEINRERLLYLTRIGVHFPIFSLLETEENIEIMHAAAVEKGGKAIVLAGYDGVGKSTLALYLCLKKGFQYVADNFLLYDGTNIYPFVESARLSEDSIRALGLSYAGNKIYGRIEVLPRFYTDRSSLKASAVFFNYLSDADALEEADKHQLKNKILAMKDYLPEFIDYRQFLSVVKLTTGTSHGHDDGPLDVLLDNARLYFLKKHKIGNLPEVAEEVLRCI